MTLAWLPDEASVRCFPIVTSGTLFRMRAHLEAVIEQFGVESHPRYQRTPAGMTKCSTLLWDVSRAMGCELPKDYGAAETLFDQDLANPRSVIVKHERNMNELIAWLHSIAAANLGWRFVDELTARARANQGFFTAAVWRNPNPAAPGHSAMLRPQPADREPGTYIAQAGGQNFVCGTLQQGFGQLPAEFVTHD